MAAVFLYGIIHLILNDESSGLFYCRIVFHFFL